MRKKREKRARGIPYLDSIDLEILQILNGTLGYKDFKIFGVLDLVDELNISHISLKPHIDKLMDLGFIRLIPMKEIPKEKMKKFNYDKSGRVGVCSVKLINNNWLENVANFDNKDERETIDNVQQQNKLYDDVLLILNHIKNFTETKKTENLFDIDLRKLETIKKYSTKK
jgi:hypothetical protein